MIIIDIPFEPKSWIAPQFSRGRAGNAGRARARAGG